MKELTYEDWMKNPTPREMWVWNDFDKCEKKRKVVYISKEEYPVVSVTLDDNHVEHYKHCAEIKEARQMTNRELSRWLRESTTREYKYKNDNFIYSYYEYKEDCEDEDVSDKIVIRENYEEWRSPVIEEE